MSRAARITVGAVVAATLAFVALVAGVMAAATAGVGGGFFDDMVGDSVDTYATAEVLDVDDEWDWPTVDVRYTTDTGEVVVTAVDWEWTDALPSVGDEVEVVYDSTDPEWAYAAADPYVEDVMADGPPENATTTVEAGPGAQERVAGWVSMAAMLGLLVTVAVTIVAAVRAPAPEDVAGGAPSWGPYGPPSPVGQAHPHQAQPPRPPSAGGSGWSSP